MLYPTKSPQARKDNYRVDSDDSDSDDSSEDERPMRKQPTKQTKQPVKQTKQTASKGNTMTIDDKLNNLNGRLKKVEQIITHIVEQLNI